MNFNFESRFLKLRKLNQVDFRDDLAHYQMGGYSKLGTPKRHILKPYPLGGDGRSTPMLRDSNLSKIEQLKTLLLSLLAWGHPNGKQNDSTRIGYNDSLTLIHTDWVNSKVLEICYEISQKKNHKSFHMCGATYI